MGRAGPTETYRDDPDAVSLHTTPDDYTYDDAPEISGLPPSYEDSEAGNAASAVPIRHAPPPTTRTDHSNPAFKNGKPWLCDTVTYMDSRYDKDPVYLEDSIRSFANAVPVPLIYIMGSHRETVRNGDKKQKKDITDFRIVINMQRYLRPHFSDTDISSMNLVTVENSDKTHRGTSFKTRAPGFKRDIEVGGPKPTLTEWCHRYCASSRALRIFRLRRVVTGMDETHIRNRLEGIIRSTNYRGRIDISFPIEEAKVDIYTTHFVNAWRNKTWVCWLFYLSFLWIISWPVLLLSTARYAVVRAEWPFSATDARGNKRYTTVSEEQWLQKWGTAVRRLALDRYQGEVSEDVMAGVLARPADPPMPGTLRTGHADVDAAVGLISQGFQVARAIQRGGDLGRGVQGGWGYDC